MSTIAIIPARGGSTRVPGKNIREFHGKPIIAYSIETAQKSMLFDRIIVSTDSDDIAAVALYYGAEVWRRDPAYGANEVGTQDVVRECIKGVWDATKPKSKKNEITEVCCIYATAPLMSVEDLRRGFRHFRHHTYAFSVGVNPLCDAGQFYWGLAMFFLQGVELIGPDSCMIPIDDRRVCDINTEDDWNRALKMYGDIYS